MKEITVCIVDDVSELRQALEEIVSSASGYKCIGTMSNPSEALTKLPILKPDVVLMDINLGETENGIDCVRELKPLLPATNFMMCTVEDASVPRVVYEPWKWTHTSYIIETSRKLSDITVGEIDPSQRLADVERKNNKIELKF